MKGVDRVKKFSDGQHNVSYSLEYDARNVLKYWTPERKASAIPILPHPDPDLEARLGGIRADSAITGPEKADLSKMPFQAGGKLFFTKGERNYVGSAQVAIKKNLLLTAAHCVQSKDTGEIWSNFLFERCYQDGSCSESLTFRTVALKSYWHEQKAWRWDYAFAILEGSSSMTDLLSYSTEGVAEKKVIAMGYPTNYYDGKSMVYVKGQAENYPDNTLILDGDKMRGGCSGGAWVLEDGSTVVGINSFGPASTDYTFVCSPVLDADFESLYQYVLSLI